MTPPSLGTVVPMCEILPPMTFAKQHLFFFKKRGKNPEGESNDRGLEYLSLNPLHINFVATST